MTKRVSGARKIIVGFNSHFSRNEEAWAGFLCVLPALIVVAVFLIFPLFQVFSISLKEWSLFEPPEFIGLRNYRTLLEDWDFWNAIRNTFYFVGVALPALIVISLGAALLMNQKIRGVTFFQAAYFSPMMTSMVAVSAVWLWIFSPKGILNFFISFFGPRLPGWLNSPGLAMPAMIIVTVWQYVGFNVIIFLASLQSIPPDFYESARIEGANSWHCFRHITLPLISPTLFVLTILAAINYFKRFDQFFVMTQGGPVRSTVVTVYYIYEQAFSYFRMGYACSLSVVLFAVVITVTVLQIIFGKSFVQYER